MSESGGLLEKREFSEERREELASAGSALPDGSFPILNSRDLRNAIMAHGRAKDVSAAKSHIIRRAKAMGLESDLPKDWVEKTEEVAEESFAIEHEIIKAFPQRKIDRRGREYRLIKSMVMSPRKIDKQNDWTDEDEIQDACHEFMINLQDVHKSEDESGLSYRHARLIKSSDARIVECCQIDFPEAWGGKEYPSGTWKIGIRLYDEKLFSEIDNGLLRGCSVEGSAIHSPQPLQS